MAKVRGGQQHQGGGGRTFEAQTRHGNGGKKNGEKMSEKQRRKQKYAAEAGFKFKEKPEVEGERRWMSVCHCGSKGTCTFCVEQRKSGRSAADIERARLERERQQHDVFGSAFFPGFRGW